MEGSNKNPNLGPINCTNKTPIMAKAKSKKEAKKKDKKKKDKKSILAKLKVEKKKDSKKKDSKKLAKKKDSGKKTSKKKVGKKKSAKKKETKKKKVSAVKPVPKPEAKPATTSASVRKPVVKRSPAPKASPAAGKADHSSNYNVKEAIAKLRAIKDKDELMAFIKGEKRVTVTKVIPAAMNRLK